MKTNIEMSDYTNKRIQKFWNSFLEEAEQIQKRLIEKPHKNPFTKEFTEKLSAISRRIHAFPEFNFEDNTNFKITFTGYGYTKLIPKVKAIVEAAPVVPNWSFQALFQPAPEIEIFKQGLDEPIILLMEGREHVIKISEATFTLLSYDLRFKKVNISVYLGENFLVSGNWEYNIVTYELLLHLLGEITLRRNVKLIPFLETPQKSALSPLYELPKLIDSMYSNRGRRRVQ